MSDKVYCAGCSFHFWMEKDQHLCKSPSKNSYTYDPVYGKFIKGKPCRVINENCDCEHFESRYENRKEKWEQEAAKELEPLNAGLWKKLCKFFDV